MEKLLLIDGYNVIFTDSALRRLYLANNDAGRERLLEVLDRYAAARSLRCAVVFDGGETEEGRVGPATRRRVETVFVKDADAYIRRRIAGSGAKGSLTVVSSDEEHIARFARSEGIEVLGTAEFMVMLGEVDRRGTGNGEKPGEETREGVEYWIRKMGAKESE